MNPLSVLFLLSMLAFNALFVAAEFALVSVRRPRLAELAGQGRRGAVRALGQYDQMSRSLSACQLGITLASIAIGAVGEKTLAHALEGPLSGTVSHAIAGPLAIIVGYMVISGTHITAAEQVPKMGGIANPERVAAVVSLPLAVFAATLRPFIWLLDRVTDLMLGALRVRRVDEHTSAATLADVRALVAEGAHGGTLEEGEADMLEGVFDLHEREARDVMTPFHELTYVTPAASAAHALGVCVAHGHSRLLVIDPDGTLLGLVVEHDLARLVLAGDGDHACETIRRDALIVPESKPLDDLLAMLQAQRASLSVVVDEYGHTAGVVSVEDILEEVVGEIHDESDIAARHAEPEQDGVWVTSGQTPLRDLQDEGLDLPDPAGAYATLAGLVMDRAGRVLAEGESVDFDGWQAQAVELDGARIARIRLTRLDASQLADAA